MSLNFNPLILEGFDLSGAGGGGSSEIVSGATPVTGAPNNSILVVDGAGKVTSLGPLTDGQILIGSSSAAAVPGTITGSPRQVLVSNGAGNITLQTPQDLDTAADVVFNSLATGTIEGNANLSIGAATSIINIGNSGSTVNINGNTIYQNVTDLNVKDKLITLNKGGSASSASGSGLELEEDNTITSYIKTSADRNSFELKAPNQTGVIVVSPGSVGFTLDQGSHNPVTIGSANGLSLAGQTLSLGLASASDSGAMSALDYIKIQNSILKDGSVSFDNASHIRFRDDTDTFDLDILGVSSNNLTLGNNSLLGIDVEAAGDVTITTPSSIFLNAGGGVFVPTPTLGPQAATKDYVDLQIVGSDIPSSSFSGTSNATNADITGFVMPVDYEAFRAIAKVHIDATASLYEVFEFVGTKKGSIWTMSMSSSGDDSDIIFDIDSAGQVKYTSGTYPGFVSMVIKFRVYSLT